MWGSIIGAGIQTAGGLIGSLLGGSKDNYHPEVARNDAYKNYIKSIQAIKDAAAKHGFHPLALLGSQPGSSFAAPVPSQDASWGVGDAVGGGISAFGDAYAEDQLREGEKEERMYEESMRRRQDAIDNLRRKEVTPEVKLQRENMRLQNDLLRMDIAQSRTKLAAARAAAIGGTGGDVLTGPGSVTFSPVPGRSSAQDAEDQYGEAGDLIFGAGGLVEDLTSGRVSVEPNALGRAEIAWRNYLKRLFSKMQGGPETPIYPGM